MPTTQHNVFGIIQYPKLFEFNRDREGYEGRHKPYGGAYTLDLIMDEENADKYEASGTAGELKEVKRVPNMRKDDEGEEYQDGHVWVPLERKDKSTGMFRARFMRKHEDAYNNGGPPQLVNADQSPYSVEEQNLIGNESTGHVFFDVYTTSMSNGTRLQAIQLVDHIEYESDGEAAPRGVEFLDLGNSKSTPPKKTTRTSKKKEVPVDEDLDDEIPF